MIPSIICAFAALSASVNAATQPPSSPSDMEYLAALVENTYCSTPEFTASGLKVANATLLKSLPYSELADQRVDVYHDPTYGIVVAYEGTNNTDWIDFLHDFDLLQVPPSSDLGLSDFAWVHHGFYQQHERVWPAVNSTVQSALNDYPDTNITVIGHSMGAAICQLGALALQHQFQTVEKVVSFAPVRVGNPEYAKEFNNVFNEKYTGIWNGQDWVPWILLPELGYLHPNNMVWINPENGTSYQFFEKSEDWSGPAGKLPKLLTVNTVEGGIEGLIDKIKSGDIYGAITPIFDLLYWGAHEGIYFHTDLYAGAATTGEGCPADVGGH